MLVDLIDIMIVAEVPQVRVTAVQHLYCYAATSTLSSATKLT